MAKRVSDEDKHRAQALFAIGKSFRDIGKQLGMSAAWLSKTAREEGWVKGVLPDKLVSDQQPQVFESANATADERAANTDKLKEAQRRRWVEHKGELADEFGEKIQLLLDRAFSPCTLKEQKVLRGESGAQFVQLVETDLHLPPPADQIKLITGVAILVDKASLLSGDATSRVETSSMNRDQLKDRLTHFRDELKERRDKLEQDNARKSDEATG